MRCVPATDFSVGKARAWRSSMDIDPPYQRPGGRWTLGRKQRFIDSLLNGFDVPKIYLHDLRGTDPRTVYAVVDGKQRLTAMWDFLDDRYPLADDFRLTGAPGADGSGDGAPAAGRRYSDFASGWRTALLRVPLAVVLIQDATVADIHELFARLNDGVPLAPEERRRVLELTARVDA